VTAHARHALLLAGRGSAKIGRDPAQLLDAVLQPVTTLVVFGFAFGGSVAGSTGAYLRDLVPGLLVQTALVASLSAGVTLNVDAGSGVIDRFRSLPIARSAPLVGAVLAAGVRYVVAGTALLVAAAVVGFRVQTGVLPLLAGLVLMVLTGLCLCWIPVLVGVLVRGPVAVQGIFLALVVPLTFGSNVFVPTASMPGWLADWSAVSPVSLLADAMRGLLVGGPVAGPLAGGLLWLAGTVAVFFPLAVRAYRNRVE
jgi:oleandomycin transport system permease protein